MNGCRQSLCTFMLVMIFLPLTVIRASATFLGPFDTYGNLCWQDERSRLDNFAIQLQNEPDLVAYKR